MLGAHVAVFGVGGVGSYAVEALVRSGIGRISIFDNDKICITNVNRQIIATTKTIGLNKVDVMKERILDINPNAIVEAYKCFYTAENADEFNLSKYDYIVDAIDTVSSKITLILKAKEMKVPIISSMGAGNKLEPTKFEVSDIYKTSVCPLAKVMRQELRKKGVKSLDVVYSKEEPIKPDLRQGLEDNTNKRQIPGSISFVPSVVGLIIAGQVIKKILVTRE